MKCDLLSIFLPISCNLQAQGILITEIILQTYFRESRLKDESKVEKEENEEAEEEEEEDEEQVQVKRIHRLHSSATEA